MNAARWLPVVCIGLCLAFANSAIAQRNSSSGRGQTTNRYFRGSGSLGAGARSGGNSARAGNTTTRMSRPNPSSSSRGFTPGGASTGGFGMSGMTIPGMGGGGMQMPGLGSSSQRPTPPARGNSNGLRSAGGAGRRPGYRSSTNGNR